jgi:hypothetical protein
LEAWNRNPNIDFHISDCTPDEIQTASVATIKNVLSRKIGEANYMIAIIGEHSNDWHRDYKGIGYRNWQSYEIEKNYEKGNGLVVVRLNSSCTIPEACYDKGAILVNGFEQSEIKKALDNLAY